MKKLIYKWLRPLIMADVKLELDNRAAIIHQRLDKMCKKKDAQDFNQFSGAPKS